MKVIPNNFAAGYAGRTDGNQLLAVVGQDLRRLYDESQPPLPDEIRALLDRLAAPKPSPA